MNKMTITINVAPTSQIDNIPGTAIRVPYGEQLVEYSKDRFRKSLTMRLLVHTRKEQVQMKRLATLFILVSLFIALPINAQNAQPTAEPTVDHTAHHPAAAGAIATAATPEATADVQAMSGTLDTMMSMPMPADMKQMMQQMHTMMTTMEGMSPAGQRGMMMGMMGMMAGMMQMDAPADAKPLMDDMGRHMERMMAGMTGQSMVETMHGKMDLSHCQSMMDTPSATEEPSTSK